MPSACDPLKESYKNSRVYKHRYKNRPAPKRCSVIKRNGEQCRNWAIPGMKCCTRHGGAAAKRNIKHGAYSKSLKINIMHFLNSLTTLERTNIEEDDYSNNNVIEQNMKLTNALLGRALEYMNDLQVRLQLCIQNIQDSDAEGRNLEVLLNDKAALERQIGTAHKIINSHQKTYTDLLKARKELEENITGAEALAKLQGNLLNSPREMLAEAIHACIQSGMLEDLNELKLLVEVASSEEDQEVIEYKYEDEEN
jgi:hypothetical protein